MSMVANVPFAFPLEESSESLPPKVSFGNGTLGMPTVRDAGFCPFLAFESL